LTEQPLSPASPGRGAAVKQVIGRAVDRTLASANPIPLITRTFYQYSSGSRIVMTIRIGYRWLPQIAINLFSNRARDLGLRIPGIRKRVGRRFGEGQVSTSGWARRQFPFVPAPLFNIQEAPHVARGILSQLAARVRVVALAAGARS
jgi:hypothetical protein